MARIRVPHHFEAAGSLITIDAKQPSVARVQFFVDDHEHRLYRAYDFSMKRSALEELRGQIDRALREAPLPARKPKASP